jgi:hypothetical protein
MLQFAGLRTENATLIHVYILTFVKPLLLILQHTTNKHVFWALSVNVCDLIE